MVRGLPRDLLLGDDAHDTGLRHATGDDADDDEDADPSAAAAVVPGWIFLLTVHSGVHNTTATGVDRVNVQSTDEATLTGIRGITSEIAKAIIAHRGQNRFESIANLLDVGPPPATTNPAPPANPAHAPSPASTSSPEPTAPPVRHPAPALPDAAAARYPAGPKLIDVDLLIEIADQVTTDDASLQEGLVNINTASLEVLASPPRPRSPARPGNHRLPQFERFPRQHRPSPPRPRHDHRSLQGTRRPRHHPLRNLPPPRRRPHPLLRRPSAAPGHRPGRLHRRPNPRLPGGRPVNPLAWLHPDTVLVEVEPRALTVLHRGRTHSWPLERSPAGSLTAPCTARLRTELPAALERHAWQPRLPARCALPASGVSLRRWQIPAPRHRRSKASSASASKATCRCPRPARLGLESPSTQGRPSKSLVAALRRDAVRELAELLTASGLDPSFTLAALARLDPGAVPPPNPSQPPGAAFLAIGSHHSEWLQTDALGPVRLRVLPWGEETVLREMATQPGAHPAPSRRERPPPPGGAPHPEGDGRPVSTTVAPALERALETLAAALPISGTLSVEGRLAPSPAFREALARRLAPATLCHFPPSPESSASSALPRGS